MKKTLQEQIEALVSEIKTKKIRIVGICGIPGAGKSTLSATLRTKLPEALCISMDGFHIRRKDLTPEGLEKRGAPFTFDYEGFSSKMRKVKQGQQVSFPTFSHAEKDPVDDAVTVPSNSQLLVVQGIYIFDPKLKMDDIWDLKVWIEVPLQEATKRLAKRHVQTGIVSTQEQGWARANGSDRENSIYIIQNCRKNKETFFVIHND